MGAHEKKWTSRHLDRVPVRDSHKHAIYGVGLLAIITIVTGQGAQKALLHTSLDRRGQASITCNVWCCGAASSRCDVTKFSVIKYGK